MRLQLRSGVAPNPNPNPSPNPNPNQVQLPGSDTGLFRCLFEALEAHAVVRVRVRVS